MLATPGSPVSRDTRLCFAVPFDRTAREIIDHWRACIRDLEEVGDDTVEGQYLRVEIERLRREYHELANEAAAAHRATVSQSTSDSSQTTGPKLEKLLAAAVRRGHKVMFTAAEGACAVCRMLDGRVFDPKIAPTIPVKGCENERCRCEYVAVPNRRRPRA